jgi:hypothetical protein
MFGVTRVICLFVEGPTRVVWFLEVSGCGEGFSSARTDANRLVDL